MHCETTQPVVVAGPSLDVMLKNLIAKSFIHLLPQLFYFPNLEKPVKCQFECHE